MGTNEVEIVGVAANTTYRNLRAPQRAVAYLSHSQPMFPLAAMGFEVRTDGDPMRYANAVRRVAAELDSRIPITDVRTQAAQIEQTINQEVVFARLCSGFAVLALVIASLGLYGSTAYRVARRTHEIGIRMALGARRSRVIRMLIRESLVLAAAGLAVGIPAALAGARYVQSFLFNMKANDAVALGAAAAVLVVSAGLAGYVPARRASKIDPMSALRHE
jgi:ABC-type antimicrobial peptide transport system permease subunit